MTIDPFEEKRLQAKEAMERHWASKVGARTPHEQKLLDELVGATYPMVVPGAASSGSALATDGSGGSMWVGPTGVHGIGPGFHDPLRELDARVRALEAKMGRIEKALTDAGKSDWDKFEELTG